MPKGLDWFRFYVAVLNCAKVQQLSDRQFRGWVNILCVAREHEGVLPELNDLAFKLRMRPIDAGVLTQALVKAKLLDRMGNGRLTPHDWNEHQYVSDVSTSRVRKFRERSRNVSETPSDSETDTEQIQTQSRVAPSVPAIMAAAIAEPSYPVDTSDPEEAQVGHFIAQWERCAEKLPSQVEWQKFRKFCWAKLPFPRKLALVKWLTANQEMIQGGPQGFVDNERDGRRDNPNAPVRGSHLPPVRTTPAKVYDPSKELD